jgi:two-component system sensor histidine kinase PilS (NtrC family)
MSDGDRELANIVVRNTQRMNDTVSNVLELSRRVPPNFTQVDVNDWILAVARDFKEASSEEASLTVTGACTWPISIDKSQLKRVLDNLIDNGLRHSESATGQRAVDLHIGQSVVQRLCFIDVIDNGEGVPDSAQARLFEPFFTTRPDGTGLGLYLCKEL